MSGYPNELRKAATVNLPPREVRRPTSLTGLVRLPSGHELPCIVKDVSSGGAKMGIPASFPLSKAFSIVVDERNVILDVMLVWRQGNFAGVKIAQVRRIPGREKWVPKFRDDDAES